MKRQQVREGFRVVEVTRGGDRLVPHPTRQSYVFEGDEAREAVARWHRAEPRRRFRLEATSPD